VKVEIDTCPKGSTQYEISKAIFTGYTQADHGTLHPNSTANDRIYGCLGNLRSSAGPKISVTIYGAPWGDVWPTMLSTNERRWRGDGVLVATFVTPHPTYIQPTGSGDGVP
jgi:hypothetical protein